MYYVSGVVSESNLVRKCLQHGLHQDELEEFRARVKDMVELIEGACRQNGVTPRALPLPSRNAYKFLKELDLDHLPLRGASDPVVSLERLSLKNVLRTATKFHNRFWKDLEALHSCQSERRKMNEELKLAIEGIEQVCKRKGTTASNLELPSLTAFSWMKYLTDCANFDDHVTALTTARETARSKRLNVSVEITNMRSLWRYTKRSNVYMFKIHEGFIHAPQEVWNALLTVRDGDCQSANLLVREFAHSEQFSEISFALETVVEEHAPKAKGRVHDLDASFERVNQTYFGGGIERPILTWNRIVTARKFGHYDRLRDTVMLSISLDDKRVPEFVIDSVMHHELLHKVHGATFVNGRRISHGPEFRRDERLFERYEEADKHLAILAGRNRR